VLVHHDLNAWFYCLSDVCKKFEKEIKIQNFEKEFEKNKENPNPLLSLSFSLLAQPLS
jgi:hypothetical protein